MASDISSIIQNELINTFESLLSLESTIDEIVEASKDEINDEQCVQVVATLISKDLQSNWNFFLPTPIAAKFEYYMLGEIGDLKLSLDDEIVDAAKEIISTIGGSLSTSIDAQGFEDISKVQFSIKDANIIQGSQINNYDHLYKVELSFNDEQLHFFIQFDEPILEFLGKIVSGENIPTQDEEDEVLAESSGQLVSGAAASILSLLGEESTENLKLLFDVNLRFSVRLGVKTFLLKDIVNWDIGQIIELEQMVNEPLDILINGMKVGEGEAVIVEGRFGVKIKYIGEKKIEI